MQVQEEIQLLVLNELDYATDDCNMCGGSGYLDLEQTYECPNCQGAGQA